MKRTHALVLAAAVVLAVGGVALYSGLGPAPGDESGEPVTEFPTATPTEPGDGGSTGPPFTFTVDDIEECGSTCRDVTVTLANEQDEPATGVAVYTRIYAGRDDTAEDDVVWEGEREVGRLEANGARTTTERVELSLPDALAVERHDGWITVVTTVESTERTVTFTDTEQVA